MPTSLRGGRGGGGRGRGRGRGRGGRGGKFLMKPLPDLMFFPHKMIMDKIITILEYTS